MGSADLAEQPGQRLKRVSEPQTHGILGNLPKYESPSKISLAPGDKIYKARYANMMALVKQEARQWSQLAAECEKNARARLGMQEEPRA